MSARDRIPEVQAWVEEALGSLPYHEEIEQGTQERRDWIAVRDHLRAAQTRLKTMGKGRA